MIRRLIGLLAVVFLPLAAWADTEPAAPTTPPPWVCQAKASTKYGQVRVQLSVQKMIPYWVTNMVLTPDHGFYVPKKSMHYKACVVTTVLTVDGKEVTVSRKDGKAVDPKELPALLRKEIKVLVFTEGKLDPYYLDVVDDEVLILTIPADMRFPFRPSLEE